MTKPAICSSCGDEIPRGRTEKLCPKCLLQAALADPYEGQLHIRCPHCQFPIEIVDEPSVTDVVCPSCQSSISLIGDKTVTFERGTAQQLGRFVLLDRLGVGAFGTVWKARDPELDRTVAIKIPRTGNHTPGDAEQFLREARAAAQLRHPNIVSVHEVGRDGDTAFIVSDFVDGVTLADSLTAGRPGVREAAELCAKIADALHHAHQAGVVHRDLKPSNVLLDREREPHISDFGLAKRDVGEITMTVDGKVLGTPAYMSPEQAKGEGHRADRRSDVYSLGVILFELLTGEKPFRGNVRMLLQQVIHDEAPSPRKLNSAIPRDLETICLKCLEKDSHRRYRTAKELAEELRRFLDGRPVLARPVSRLQRGWRWCRRSPIVASLSGIAVLLLVLVALVSAVAAWQIADRNQQLVHYSNKVQTLAEESDRRSARLEVAEGNRLAASGDLLGALPHFVSALALEEKDEQRAQVHRLRIGSALSRAPRLLAEFRHGAAVRHAAFSPDGQQIATASDDKTVQVWDARTGQRLFAPLDHRRLVKSVAFAAEGRFLVSVAGDEFWYRTGTVHLWDANTGDPIMPPLQHSGRVEQALLSTDGTCIVTVEEEEISRDVYRYQARLWTVPEGRLIGILATVDDNFSDVMTAVLNADGNNVAISRDKEVRLYETATGKAVGEPIALEGLVTRLAFSADGSLLAIASNHVAGESRTTESRIGVWQAGTVQRIGEVLHPRGRVAEMAISGDNQRLIVVREGGRLWVGDIASGNREDAAGDATPGGWNAWIAPDLLHMAAQDKSGFPRVYRLTSDEPLTPLLRHTGQVTHVAFDATASSVVTASVDGTARLWEIANEPPTSPSLEESRLSDYYTEQLSSDGRLLLRVDKHRRYELWDAVAAERLTPMRALPPHLPHPNPRGLSLIRRDCRVIYTISPGGELQGTETATGKTTAILALPHNATKLRLEQASADPPRLILRDDQNLHFIDAQRAEQVTIPWPAERYVLGVSFSEDGRLALVQGEHEAHIVAVKSGATPVALVDLGNTWKISTASISPDGACAIVGANQYHDEPKRSYHRDGWLGVYRVTQDGREEGKLQVQRVANPVQFPGRYLAELAFTSDGTQFLSVLNSRENKFGRSDTADVGEVTVWETRSAAPVVRMPHPDHCTAHLAGGAARIITRCDDGAVRIWETASGKLLAPPIKSHELLSRLAVSPSGQLLAAGTDKGEIGIWDALTGQSVTPLSDWGGWFGDIVFTRRQASGSPVEDEALVAYVQNDDVAMAEKLTLAQDSVAALTQRAALLSASGTLEPGPLGGASPQVAAGDSQRTAVAWHRKAASECFRKYYFDAALWQHQQLLNIEGDTALTYLSRATVWESLGNRQSILADCTKALELMPAEDRALLKRGETYASLSRWGEAAQDYARLAILFPEDYDLAMIDTMLKLRTAGNAAFEPVAQRLLADHAVVESYIREDVLRICLLPAQLENAEQLLARVEKYIAQSRVIVASDQVLHAAALLRAGQSAEALAKLRLVQPEDVSSATTARAQALQAQALEHLGDADKAAVLRSEIQEYVEELGADDWRERLELELLMPQVTADKPPR